mgnify:FL=1
MARKKNTEPVKALISREYADKLTVHDDKTPGGRRAADVADSVADLLRGKSLDELRTIANKHGLSDRLTGWEKSLNFGMIRMNLGNVLRRLNKEKAEGKADKGKKKAA